MSAKTIALDTEAYGLLFKAKRPGETFSEVVKRALGPRRPLTDFAGAWTKEMGREEIDLVRGTIATGRRSDRARLRRLDARGR
ncbi:hypothetical protein B1B_03290 [mine drainage metagenome]|uniref:Antitoxin n=1 Tax=mine drainage metagenome TaxID=410659 RepID=T1CUD5_9ZZZZ